MRKLGVQQRFALTSLAAIVAAGAFIVPGHAAAAVVLALLWVALQVCFAAVAGPLRRWAAHHERHALYDPVTELPNRILFHDQVQQAVLVARREGKGVAVVVMDLDRFKEVNDTLGHHEGDLLLARVGARLSELMGSSTPPARLGGDEFAICLPAVDGADAALLAARELRGALAAPFDLDGLTLAVEAATGIALCPDHGDDPETLIQRAEMAMYEAKGSGAGCELYSHECDRSSSDRLALVGELLGALSSGELVLHFQPKVSLAEHRTVGVEALVRWQHPARGLLPPAEFVPPAERTELFRPLTLWVLDAALAQVARWRERGLELDIAVNLSPRNLIDSDLPADVALLLERHGVAPSRLELEITEGTLMADASRACAVLERLREQGVRIAIDDFGTGYSSLSYLKRLPIDTIKVDRSFVMAMEESAADAAIVRSTIALAANLGLTVVAEGVESETVLRELARLGCDAAQGFHMSRPLPAAELEAWLGQAAPSAASRSSTGGLSVRSPL